MSLVASETRDDEKEKGGQVYSEMKCISLFRSDDAKPNKKTLAYLDATRCSYSWIPLSKGARKTFTFSLSTLYIIISNPWGGSFYIEIMVPPSSLWEVRLGRAYPRHDVFRNLVASLFLLFSASSLVSVQQERGRPPAAVLLASAFVSHHDLHESKGGREVEMSLSESLEKSGKATKTSERDASKQWSLVHLRKS